MRVEARGHGLIVDEPLTPDEQADEYLLMGLRLAEGIDPRVTRRCRAATLDAASASRS